MKPILRAALAAAFMAATLVGGANAQDAKAGGLAISDAWVRPNLPNRPTAAYLSIENGGTAADRLVGARSDAFEAIELHTVVKDGEVMTMRPVEAIDLPAGGHVALEPGGHHLMLFGASKAFAEGDSVPLVLRFEAAGEVTLDVPVKKPSAGMGHGMDHGTGQGMGGGAGQSN